MSHTFSSLSRRFLLALGGVLCLSLLTLLLVARYQIMPVLLEDENQYASGELDRIERALGAELRHMERLVEDWAWWDDTYRFVRGERPQYVASNLYHSTLETLDLGLMVFFSADNRPYWIAGIEDGDFTVCSGATPEARAPCDWADDTLSLLQERIDNGLEEGTHARLLAAPELGLVGLSPIYTTHEERPPAGWLAMVRPITPPLVAQLRETTGIELSLSSAPRAGAAPAMDLARTSSTRMAASRHVSALPETHGLRIDADLPRQRYQASLETFRFALYWTGGVLVVTLVVVLLLLEHMVLRPLRQLSRFTQRLHQGETQAGTPAALLKRNDEIGTLAREFQHLLDHQQQQADELLDLSQHDPLTGLANRRLFDERLREALEDGPSARQEVSVLMVDIDHFKHYNDHYGHPAGDACLVALADRMDHHLGSQGFLVARTGGEEFSVVLPGTPIDAAVAHAEALRCAITELALPHAASPIDSIVTVSIGAAARATPAPNDPGALMRAADQALYQAKAQGRNRVMAYCPAVAGATPR
ncbi:diguanylate cyclase domain-containing protein [Halomonas sp. C05BenzN]|uniref:GGDEF domain-containing protein n=1 Tax=Halomonas sp. C05BenzN TaxID=3411041 RepID=UPI003B94E5E5